MYDPSNFTVTMDSNSLINMVTGGTASFSFNVKNLDLYSTLYNVSFQLTLGDGMEFVNSSVPYTSQLGNTMSFTNVKDLAPNETSFKITIDVKLSTVYENGNSIPFGSLVSCSFEASADTMPRGIYDNNNEVIESSTEFTVKACRFTIYKENPSGMLLGESYVSKLIIQTAENASTFFSSIEEIWGDGFFYVGNMIITGYDSLDLRNVQITIPQGNNENWRFLWSNVYIPVNTKVVIQYEIKFNERYYVNGVPSGNYIKHGASVSNSLNATTESESVSYSYAVKAFEMVIIMLLSKYKVDINKAVRYSIRLKCNMYHSLYGASARLITSKGQLMASESAPMFSSRIVAHSGATDIYWNFGKVNAGTSILVTIDGSIATIYSDTDSDVLAGDTFTATANGTATTETDMNVISATDNAELMIDAPQVSKSITGIYYRDNTPKPYDIVAPGDRIRYKSIYDSNLVMAPSGQVKLYDFYPYNTKDINDVQYEYSSQQYPGTTAVSMEPYGAMWYVNRIAGGQTFSIDYNTQIKYNNVPVSFLNNLFKLQVKNISGITYSTRDQKGFVMGKPNFVTNKTVTGNDVNKIKIGEQYTISLTLLNDSANMNATDAFNFSFNETIASGVTLDEGSIVCKINEVSITPVISGGNITINIDKLAPGEVFTLVYHVIVNDTLAPNSIFTFNSSTTLPYTQVYDAAQSTNLQYDIQSVNKTVQIKSENIQISIYSDAPTKIIGEEVNYYLKIVIPKGQVLSRFYGLIMIPSSQTYINEAYLNGVAITPIINNSTIIFPTIYNVDSTGGSIQYIYRVRCIVTNSIVSSQQPTYTIETLYGHMNYITLLNNTVDIGANNVIRINHPHLSITMGLSSDKSNFLNNYIMREDKYIYIRIVVSNLSDVQGKNASVTINLPVDMVFYGLEEVSQGVTVQYNQGNSQLQMSIDSVQAGTSKYILFKCYFNSNIMAESKFIISAELDQYFNTLSNTKIYSSRYVHTGEIYVGSCVGFKPLTIYALTNSMAALNLSASGDSTSIKFLIKNTGQGIDSYKLSGSSCFYGYDVYVGDNFIEHVNANTALTNLTALEMTNIPSGESAYVELRYTIPEEQGTPKYATMLITATSLNNVNTKSTIPVTLQDP